MSLIETTDEGLDSVANRLSTLLSQPETSEVPIEAKASRNSQRNTVLPAQESAPDPASAEEDTGSDGESPIEPPASWDDEAKAKWAKLPDDVKTLVTQREAARERAINQKLQETAEIRKKAETETAQTLQARTAYEQRLMTLARQLEGSIPPEFRNIRSPQDLAALADKDPATAQKFLIWREMANSVVNEIQQLEHTKQQEQSRAQQDFIQRETDALVEKWPEAADPVKGPAIRNEIVSVLKEFGFSQSEIDGIADHRIILFARKYIEQQSVVKANASAKTKVENKPLPRVVKPGQGEGTGSAGSGLTKAQLSKVARSGDMGATQAALEKLLAN